MKTWTCKPSVVTERSAHNRHTLLLVMALAWHSMQFASQAVILSGLFREREKERARIQKVKFMYFLTETFLDWGIRWIETYAALCCASKSWAEVQS